MCAEEVRCVEEVTVERAKLEEEVKCVRVVK